MRKGSWICGVSAFSAMALACGFASFPEPEAQSPMDLDGAPVAVLPENVSFSDVEPGVAFGEVRLASAIPGQQHAGSTGTLWVYRPSGVEPGTAPAVVIAPAGSTLLTGMPLASGDQWEHLPYVRRGMVVVAYDLDGHGDGLGATKAFARAAGGVVNGRRAIDLALSLPEVDPERVFAVGHSSASTAALLLGANDQRLAGVVSYNGDGQGCWSQGKVTLSAKQRAWDGFADFCQATRPLSYAGSFEHPVYVFGSYDDVVVSGRAARHLATSLESAGVSVTANIGHFGDHYGSMIETGIPAAVEWIATSGTNDRTPEVLDE